MSLVSKTKSPKDILNMLHYEMCDTIYRHLYFLMVSLRRKEINLELDDTIITFQQSITTGTKGFTIQAKGKKENYKKTLGYLNFNSKTYEDCVLTYIMGKPEYSECCPDKYSKWFSIIKTKMQSLMDEQKIFEDILDDIRKIPIFSPERQVIIEKK